MRLLHTMLESPYLQTEHYVTLSDYYLIQAASTHAFSSHVFVGQVLWRK